MEKQNKITAIQGTSGIKINGKKSTVVEGGSPVEESNLKRRFQCKKCDKTYAHQPSLFRHLKMVHGNCAKRGPKARSNSTEVDGLPSNHAVSSICPICMIHFATQEELTVHVKSIHVHHSIEDESTAMMFVTSGSDFNAQQLFHDESHLSVPSLPGCDHISFNGEVPYFCPLCNVPIIKEQLREHVALHHPEYHPTTHPELKMNLDFEMIESSMMNMMTTVSTSSSSSSSSAASSSSSSSSLTPYFHDEIPLSYPVPIQQPVPTQSYVQSDFKCQLCNLHFYSEDEFYGHYCYSKMEKPEDMQYVVETGGGTIESNPMGEESQNNGENDPLAVTFEMPMNVFYV